MWPDYFVQEEAAKADERQLLHPNDELTRKAPAGVRFGPPPAPNFARASSSSPSKGDAKKEEAPRQEMLLPDYHAVERAAPGVRFGPAKRLNEQGDHDGNVEGSGNTITLHVIHFP
jgi:hypothetical protein